MLRKPMTITRAIPALLLFGMAACSAGDVVSLPPKEATDLFWAVRNNAKPLTVAVGESYQLTAKSFNASGAVITDLPKPVFRSVDSTRVHVDSNGLVTGRIATDGIDVIASLTINGVTRADTTPVAVTAQRHAIKSFKLQTAGGDAIPSVVAIGSYIWISVDITDSSDAPVFGTAVTVFPLDSRIAIGSVSLISGKALGKTKVVAQATSYGRVFADTVEVGVIYATSATVYFGPGALYSDAVVLGVGGSITWNNNSYLQTPANIKFEEPDKVTGGDVPLINYMETATRTFPTVGIYKYTNTLSGAKGTIYVREQPTY